MNEPGEHQDLLREVPSASRRVWLGLCVILTTFGFFAWYMAREIHSLENFQANVVQQNRKSSLQLLRLQNDSYMMAISIRDMALKRSAYPLSDWKPTLLRLRDDMEDAARLEEQYTPSAPETNAMRQLLHADLDDLSRTAERTFALSEGGHPAEARRLVETDLENKRANLTAIVAQMLRMNDQAQRRAAEKIASIYRTAKWDLFIATGLLFVLALATGLYVLQASRRAFEKLQHLAEQLRAQSSQLRELSWRLIDLQEQTLRRIAVDLHDEFGQILTAVGLLLRRGANGWTEGERQRELETAQALVQETLQKVRDQSQMLHPAILDDFGLEQALEWLVQQFSRQTRMAVDLQSNGPEFRVPPEDAIHLFRIVQEALSNVARHAQASRAWVRLSHDGNELIIEVGDNGCGFEVDAAEKRASRKNLGLTGMRERAEHLKGTLAIDSLPGQGTAVRVCVTLKGDSVESAEAV